MVKTPFRILPLLAALTCAGTGPTHAAWVENGIPVAPTVDAAQHIPNVCADGANGAYIVWQQYSRADRGDAYLQRVAGDGSVPSGWPSSGLALSTRVNTQFASNLAPDMQGGVYVAWWTLEDPSVHAYRLLRVQADGTSAPGWPAEGLALPIGSVTGNLDGICGDGAGGVYVVSTSSEYDILMLHLGGDGTVVPGWSPTGQPLVGNPSPRLGAELIPDDTGGFLAAWFDGRDGGSVGASLYALKVLPTGAPAPGWPADGVRVNSIPTAQENMKVVSDGAGGLYVAWNDNRNGVYPPIPLDYEIYGQHVLADGTLDPRWPADGLPIVNAPSAQYFFDLVADGSGGLIAVWDDYRAGAQIYAVRLHPEATVASGWTVNGAPMAPHSVNQTIPSAVGDGMGGVYAFWEQSDPGGNSDAVGQHLGSDGAPAPGWLTSARMIAGSDASYFLPIGTSDGAGGAIVAYTRGTPTSRLIYAQRVLADGPVPTRIAFLDAEVEPGLARLRWSASDAGSARATVQRRSDGAPWVDRGEASPQGEAVLAFEDREATPGRYAYRLALGGAGGMEFTEETWVEIPSAYTLALAGFVPNPATGPLVLGFTLPVDGPAVVTVHDVRGRAVLTRDVSSLGPGRHRLDLGGDARLPAGVYWIRLTSGDRVLRTRGVVLR